MLLALWIDWRCVQTYGMICCMNGDDDEMAPSPTWAIEKKIRNNIALCRSRVDSSIRHAKSWLPTRCVELKFTPSRSEGVSSQHRPRYCEACRTSHLSLFFPFPLTLRGVHEVTLDLAPFT